MEIQSLKLYHFPGSRSSRVRWALHETVGDDFEVETVALMEGEQYGPEFLQLNPNHSVPVLEIMLADDSVHHMLESVAMVEWLADAYPDTRLAPAPALTLERADYLQMMQFAGSWMDSMLWQIRVHGDLLPEAEADPRTVARYREKFAQEVEPQLLARLEHGYYICGADFSAADIVVGHNVLWAQTYELCADATFRDYVGRLAERDAFRKAFADMRGRA
jgi:glutathione S-transferase